jgi:uncharacterized membrane protein YozB (DUF420 family)
MSVPSNRPAWFLLSQHWVSLLGMALVATALVSWLVVLPQTIRGHVDNPYLGIIVFLIVPVIFFAGLALIPIGIYLGRRQIRRGVVAAELDRKKMLRRVAWFFGVTTLLNLVIGTQFTYRAQAYGNATILWSDLPRDEELVFEVVGLRVEARGQHDADL